MAKTTFKSHQINSNEVIFYQEIKNIPNQILDLRLEAQDKCSHLVNNNPYNEKIGYQIRYKFETGITGTWRFQRKYGLKLRKNLTSNFSKNEILYIKEPFIIDGKENKHYKFNSNHDDTKFTHQRFMKQEDARYFVQMTNVEISKL